MPIANQKQRVVTQRVLEKARGDRERILARDDVPHKQLLLDSVESLIQSLEDEIRIYESTKRVFRIVVSLHGFTVEAATQLWSSLIEAIDGNVWLSETKDEKLTLCAEFYDERGEGLLESAKTYGMIESFEAAAWAKSD